MDKSEATNHGATLMAAKVGLFSFTREFFCPFGSDVKPPCLISTLEGASKLGLGIISCSESELFPWLGDNFLLFLTLVWVSGALCSETSESLGLLVMTIVLCWLNGKN